jgi:hypothetical protein
MICSSVCLLRFIVWSFLKARLQFTLDQFNGATSSVRGLTDVAGPSAEPLRSRMDPNRLCHDPLSVTLNI